MTDAWITRQTLLAKAKDPHDEGAWREFVDYYHPFIHVVLAQMQVSANDRDDVTQTILIKLWRQLLPLRSTTPVPASGLGSAELFAMPLSTTSGSGEKCSSTTWIWQMNREKCRNR